MKLTDLLVLDVALTVLAIVGFALIWKVARSGERNEA